MENEGKHPGEQTLNIQVSRELKTALKELAQTHNHTMAHAVRTILQFGIPILRRIWESERKLIDDPGSVVDCDAISADQLKVAQGSGPRS